MQPVDPVQQVKHPEFSQTAILFSLNIHEPLCYAQMYEDLGDLLGVSAASPSKLSESSETEGENLDGACRLSLSGKFVSGTGEVCYVVPFGVAVSTTVCRTPFPLKLHLANLASFPSVRPFQICC